MVEKLGSLPLVNLKWFDHVLNNLKVNMSLESVVFFCKGRVLLVRAVEILNDSTKRKEKSFYNMKMSCSLAY